MPDEFEGYAAEGYLKPLEDSIRPRFAEPPFSLKESSHLQTLASGRVFYSEDGGASRMRFMPPAAGDQRGLPPQRLTTTIGLFCCKESERGGWRNE
jgi:hypothetical protein